MTGKSAIIALFCLTLILVASFGCGSDDKGTDSTTTQLGDQEAYEQISANFDSVGIEAIGAAIFQATSNWDGYVEPNIDDFLGGYGKVAAPEDTVWYEYRNGWHIFYADSTHVMNFGTDTWTFDFIACDSVQFKVDGAILPFPEEPTYLDERAHIDVDFTMANDTASLSMGLLAYVRAVLELVTVDDLMLNLTERFTFSTVVSGPQVQNAGAGFVYEIVSTDLMFSSADGFTCPTSGEIGIAVSIEVSDGTKTATASGTIEIVVADGDATVTITVGAYSDTVVYEDICSDEWAAPSFGSIVESAMR